MALKPLYKIKFMGANIFMSIKQVEDVLYDLQEQNNELSEKHDWLQKYFSIKQKNMENIIETTKEFHKGDEAS